MSEPEWLIAVTKGFECISVLYYLHIFVGLTAVVHVFICQALFQTLPFYYHTTATYSSFPSHVSRYTEQRINSTPHHLDRLLPERYCRARL